MSGEWWKHGVIYQIYPRSFADSDGDGVGDLTGITGRLDYLAELGVTAIWLSPFYPSPLADFGYDVADYCDVDPVFGDLAAFDDLVTQAHERNLRVVIDWVPNHTSDGHPWFVESRAARSSAKRDWYVWRDPAPDGGHPNNWRSAFRRVGPAWTFDETTGQYYLHSFHSRQPDLNWDNPAVRAALHDVLRFWLDRGVDGFRIDVVHKIGKDPRLADNPADVTEDLAYAAAARHDEDWASVHPRLRELRSVVDAYPDRMLVGEVYILDQERLVAYVNSGDELHLGHNFVFVHLPWDAGAFRSAVDELESLIEPRAWPAWFLNNHDQPRVPSRYDSGGLGADRAAVAAMLVLTLRGTPFVYQGEELGLPDAPIPADRVVDVDGRDPERAPVPWAPRSQAGPGAGFTTGDPWLPITPQAEQLAAAVQEADPDSMLHLYRRLIACRRGSAALRDGSYRSLDAGEGVFAFVRDHPDQRVLVALNFTPESVRPGLGALPASGGLLVTTAPATRDRRVDLRGLQLAPHEGVVVALAPR